MALRLATRVLSAALLATSLGCPPGHPPGPRSGACDDLSDCNEISCGDLVPCVRGFCLHDAPRVRVVCHDAGADASLYECDYFTECNEEACGEDLIACIRGRCDPDAPRLQVPCDPDCVEDFECIVALPLDRCCGPCPEAMSRADLAKDPCRYPADVIPPGPGPENCYDDCGPCRTCEDVPYTAVCTGAECSPRTDHCNPDFQRGLEMTPAEAAARGPELLRQLVTITGTAGIDDEDFSCAPEISCNPGPSCVAPIEIDGIIEIRGTNCGEAVQCSDYVVGPPDTPCTGDLVCRPLAAGTTYRVSGIGSQDGATFYLELQSFEAVAY